MSDQDENQDISERSEDVEGTNLEDRVREWLESSGKKSELQAKLRAELFGAIQTELAFRGDLDGVAQSKRNSSKKEKLLNWLVSEHLTSNKHWLTNSVFVSEAEIETVSERPVITSQLDKYQRSHLKQYDTEVVTKETVVNILTSLGINPESELLKSVLNNLNLKQKSVLSSIFDGLSSADVCRDLGARPRQEFTIPETLRSIDDKYDKILDNFKTKRKEILNNGEKPCSRCIYLEGALIKKKEKNEAVETDELSSVSFCEAKTKTSRRKSNKTKDLSESIIVAKQNENFENLFKKIDEFLVIKEKERSNVENQDSKLKQYEEEIVRLKIQMRDKEEEFKRHQYEENIKSLNNLISSQNEKLVQQNTELIKMKNVIEVQKLTQQTFKNSTQLKEKIKSTEDNTAKESPTVNFLEDMKNKLTNLEKEERLIDDDLEEISIKEDSK